MKDWESFSVRFPDDIAKEIADLAKAEGLSKNQIINDLVVEGKKLYLAKKQARIASDEYIERRMLEAAMEIQDEKHFEVSGSEPKNKQNRELA